MSRYLIAGLGNIGPEYAHTRHNIGFDVADAFAAKHGGRFKNERLADMAVVQLKGREIVVIKPTTYMNLSGRAVKYWMDNKKIDLGNILVIVDEIALPLNKLRLRPSGSSAGHNGLRSIEEALVTTDYPRLRFGVGNNYPKGMQVEYVLSRWTQEELPLVQYKTMKSVEVIESFIFTGIDRTMTEVNKIEFVV
ncbi:MAG: aminoacyl-tRNA hydrolase [Chitinophagaceae bacterium]|nr:aminoacyl-tRNA hydrolase [Chitinophagaceae bacterium]